MSELKSGTKANTEQWPGRVIWIVRSLAGVCSLVKPRPGTPRRDICPGEAAQLSVATKGCQRNFAEHDSEKEPAGDFSLLKVPIMYK